MWGSRSYFAYAENCKPEIRERLHFNHSTNDLDSTLAKFASAPDNAVFASASITMGYDFHGDLARRIIIPTVPYGDISDLATKVRSNQNKRWYALDAMSKIIQMSGRATRSADDWSEVFIVDSRWTQFYNQWREEMPTWFRERVGQQVVLPPEPPAPSRPAPKVNARIAR